jgi:hypothetical protein
VAKAVAFGVSRLCARNNPIFDGWDDGHRQRITSLDCPLHHKQIKLGGSLPSGLSEVLEKEIEMALLWLLIGASIFGGLCWFYSVLVEVAKGIDPGNLFLRAHAAKRERSLKQFQQQAMQPPV